MADDLSLLLKLRGENAQLKSTLADSRAAIAQLRSSSGSDFTAMQGVATQALGSVTQSLTQVTNKIPVFGFALNSATSEIAATGKVSAGLATELSGLFAAMGPVGIAAAGIVVEVAAMALVLGTVVQVGSTAIETFLDLAKSAAGFRGELFDLSQQTGVSVELLSALGAVAENTGGNIQSVSQSLVIFQGHLDDASDSSSKSAELLDKLGITVSDTETAFRDALVALAAMPAGFEQTNAAAELFGRRGGKQMLAILKETGGDIDSVIERMRELRTLTTGEDAAIADEFLDSLNDLNRQFKSLAGKEAIPAATAAVKELSRFLEENHEIVDALGVAVAFTGDAFKGLIFNITSAGEAITSTTPGLTFMVSLYERLAGASRQIVSLPGLTGGVSGSGPFSGVTGSVEGVKPGRKPGKTDAERELERDLAGQLKAFQDLNQELTDAANAYSGVDTKTRVYAVTQEILNGSLKNAAKGLKDMALAAAADIDAIAKQLAAKKELKDFTEAESEAARQALEGDKDRQQTITELIEKIRAEGETVSSATEFRLRMNAAIQDSIDRLKDLTEQMREQAKVEADNSKARIKQIEDEEIARRAGKKADKDAGPPPPPLPIPIDWKAETITAGIDTMRDAFDALGQAVGSVVEAFVLYGNAGSSVRKVTAEIIASVAKQAAIKAVFELAEGFAALAMAFFGIPNAGPSASTHFAAAAIYGSIAGIAAVAGRGVAGDSFTKSAGGPSGNSERGSAGPLDTIRQGRNERQQPQTLHVAIHVDDSHFGKAVTATVVNNFNDGGEIREVISNDGR